MKLKHHFTVPSSLADTWQSFNQLEEIAPCFPGATLTNVEEDSFTGTVKIKLGPIAMMYAGTGEFLSRDEAVHTVVIRASGKDKRGNGTAGATVTAVLAADGEGTTVDVSTDMNVTGKPAQFGRGVIQDISDKLLEQFVQCVIDKAGQHLCPASALETRPEAGRATEQKPKPPPRERSRRRVLRRKRRCQSCPRPCRQMLQQLLTVLRVQQLRVLPGKYRDLLHSRPRRHRNWISVQPCCRCWPSASARPCWRGPRLWESLSGCAAESARAGRRQLLVPPLILPGPRPLWWSGPWPRRAWPEHC